MSQIWLKPGQKLLQPESNEVAQQSSTISQVQGNKFNSDVCPCFESSLYLNNSLRHLHETDINQHKTTFNTQRL